MCGAKVKVVSGETCESSSARQTYFLDFDSDSAMRTEGIANRYKMSVKLEAGFRSHHAAKLV